MALVAGIRSGRCHGNAGATALGDRRPLPVNEWSHVAATFDNRIMRLYVNGEGVATKERHGFINPGDSITIGSHSAGMDRARFRGWLDSVRVYRRVLSPEECRGPGGGIGVEKTGTFLNATGMSRLSNDTLFADPRDTSPWAFHPTSLLPSFTSGASISILRALVADASLTR